MRPGTTIKIKPREQSPWYGEALAGMVGTVVPRHEVTGRTWPANTVPVRLDGSNGVVFIDSRLVEEVKPPKPPWAERVGTVVRTAGRDIFMRDAVGWKSARFPHDDPRTYEELYDYACRTPRGYRPESLTVIHQG